MFWLDLESVRTSAPRFVEDGGSWSLTLDVPGVRREDVDVTLDRGVLTISARRELESVGKLLHSERRGWSSKRSWNLPDGVEADAIAAALTDGVLTVTLRKPTPVPPRRIDVELH
jgi:HSP20 family protein